MNALPVIAREMRAESRRSVNFGLRVLSAATLIVVFGGFIFGVEIDLALLGAALFGVLKLTLLLAFWIIVPLMTADCVSREKREGTLGLLFLTPLTPVDVIAGKAAVHILRAVTLFLAALPILGLPFVFGGVSRVAFWSALSQLAGTVFLGIAAGIYASTRGGTATQVMVMAEGYAFLLGLAWFSWVAISGGLPPGGTGAVLWSIGTSMLLVILLFRIMLRASIKQLIENWQQEEDAPEKPRWTEDFARSDLSRTVFQWDKNRTLDRNPIAWLQEYSWTARLTKWGWFGGLILAEFFFLAGPFAGSQVVLIAALSAGVAFSAVGSFRRERHTGLLELLLVTPLSVRQVINGRLWGIFCHFFPAVAVLLVCWYGDHALNPRLYHSGLASLILPNPLTFALVMIVGFYFSLSAMPFLLAWLLTWVFAFGGPPLTILLIDRIVRPIPRFLPSLLEIAIGALALFFVYRNVKLRKFLRPET